MFESEEELDEEIDEDLIEEFEEDLDENEKDFCRQNLMELEEEEKRLYRMNEGFEEGEFPDEEHNDEDDVVRESQAFKVVTQDGVNYYDEQGRFLYKIA